MFLSQNVGIRHFLSKKILITRYALRAKTLANLRSEPTPHFMRFMRFVQYGLLRVRNPLTVWYLILATGGILVLALVVYTV